MTDSRQTQDTIRLYLLGKLAGEERGAFEHRLFTEDNLIEELLSAEDELIDDYLTGDLNRDEVAMFEKTFLVTYERRQKLRLGKAFRTYAQKASAVPPKPIPLPARWNWQQLFSSPLVRGVAFAAVLLISAIGVWRIFFYDSEVDKGLLALNNAYREQRPVEARITQLDYAPFVTTRGSESDKVNEAQLRLAEVTLLTALNNKPTSAVRHALGKVYLAKKDFNQAIEYFNQALKDEPANAQFSSDLGAAYLERAKTDDDRGSESPNESASGKRMQDLARALEALNKALELSPNLQEALFNRALVHQEMLLRPQAEADWRKYLERDSNSKWADEAKRYLARLGERTQSSLRTRDEVLPAFVGAYEQQDEERAWEIVRHSRDSFSAGKMIRDQLLDQFLIALSSDDSGEAKSKLQALTFLGKLEAQRTGDLYTSELTRFYGSSSPKDRETLKQARELMKRGQQYYGQAKPLEAIKVFDESKQLFAKAGDRWEAQYAELWIGYCYVNSSDTQRAVAVLKQLTTLFEQQNYKWHLMRALHLLSGAEYNLSEYSLALEHNQRSFALAEQIGDAIGAFSTLSILIEQYRNIGNYGKALACIQRSLLLMDSCPLNEVQIAQHFGIIASLLSSAGFYPAAAEYQKEAVRRVLTTSHIQNISRAYGSLGLIYGKMGNYAEALKNAKLAYDTAKSHSDKSIRHGMMAYTSLQLGNLYKESGDFVKAIENYDECLELYESLNNYYGLYEAHKNRLSCYVWLKNDAAAKEELQTTLALAEKYRAAIREGDNRNHFFDLEQSVYDLAIDFEYSRMNNNEKAFEYSEASRSRTLLDLVNSRGTVSNDTNQPDIVFRRLSQPLMLRDIQRRMPDQSQILQYAVLSDRVLIWVISKEAVSTIESKVGQKELTQKVFDYVQALSDGGNPKAVEDAKRLFEILIKPIQPLLIKNNSIYVVPDKALNYLPFVALISPDSNRFLVEDYLTVISPSSSLFINSTDIAHKKKGKSEERILSIGNPSFDRSEFPLLPLLPSAAREAEKIAGYYPAGLPLIWTEATKPRLLMEIQKADVIHFALHSVFDQRLPLRSKLLLAKDRSGNVLEAHEIYRMKLPQTRLVVLSACQSGVEKNYGGEGMISLARPFLAAGVPLVVASFWPVESESTAELMISFHKQRKQDNLSTAEALRRAQLEMLKSSDERLRNPYCWAGFTAVGGWTTF